MKIVFDPSKSKSNEYINVIVRGLERHGVVAYPISAIFRKIKLFLEVEIVHLNWYENIVGNSRSQLLLSFVKQFAKLLILKVTNKKIVWTMHNKLSHNKELLQLKLYLQRRLISWSSLIVIHNNDSLDILKKVDKSVVKKVFYLSHPSYIDTYGNIVDDNTHPNSLILLLLGAIKPYKNIEMLIDIIDEINKINNDEISLLVAGKPETISYGKWLRGYCQEKLGVSLKLSFIPNEEIPVLLASCDLLVLPYNIESSLNSGSAIMAFSYGKSVICPSIGTIKDLQNKKCVFSYEYESEEDHYIKLKDVILQVHKLKKGQPDIFRAYGETMRQEMIINNNPDELSRQLAIAYFNLMNT